MKFQQNFLGRCDCCHNKRKYFGIPTTRLGGRICNNNQKTRYEKGREVGGREVGGRWVGEEEVKGQPFYVTTLDSAEKAQEISKLCDEYVNTVKVLGKIIIDERSVPAEHKTIAPLSGKGK